MKNFQKAYSTINNKEEENPPSILFKKEKGERKSAKEVGCFFCL